MPSGWEVYYVVFLSALLALGIPFVLRLLSSLFSGRGPRARVLPSSEAFSAGPRKEQPFFPGKRVNVRFFLATNAALVLIALMLTIVPGAGSLQAKPDRPELFRTLFSIVSVAVFAAIGLLYSATKGDLSWLRSMQELDGLDRPRAKAKANANAEKETEQ